MALKDYYSSYTYYHGALHDNTWIAQTFTPSDDYIISSLELYLFADGAPLVDFIVSIRATEDGKPVGDDLCSVTQSDISGSYDWRELIFDSPISLTNSVLYAIVARAPEANGSDNQFLWAVDTTGESTYESGEWLRSTDGGENWTSYLPTKYDAWFRTYSIGGARNPIPADGARGIIISGIDALRYLRWEAPE